MKTLRLMGYTIKLHEVDEIEDLDGRNPVGTFSWASMTIELRSDLTPVQRDEVLLHEVLEAINAICELELPHPTLATLSAALHAFHTQNRFPVFGGEV